LEQNGFRVEKMDCLADQAANAICRYATENTVDQIIMQCHNEKGIDKFLMGSVSEAVFRRAKQPVLVFNPASERTLSVSHTEKIDLSITP